MTLAPIELSDLASRITPIEDTWLQTGRARQDDLTRPPDSLEELEAIGVRFCGVAARYPPPVPSNPKVIAFAADRGAYAQGVMPQPQGTSVQMAVGIAIGFAGVYAISRAFGVGAEVFSVGLLRHAEGTMDHCIAVGTADFTQGPATTVKQALETIGAGVEAANTTTDSGADVLVSGEVGLANIMPATVLTTAFIERSMAEVTGREAGADDEMLAHKVMVIERGFEVGGVVKLVIEGDTVSTLAAVGGFEYTVMTGPMLVVAARRVPAVLGEVVSCSAVFVARAIYPDVTGYLIAGYAGVEPAITTAHEAFGPRRLVDLGLRFGEGSSGALTLPLVRAAALIANEVDTFSDRGVSKA